MENRRVFLKTLALGSVPVLVGVPVAVRAQSSVRDRVLQQVGREAARIYNAGKTTGLRGEHFRAAAANLRVFASVGLDADVRTALQQQLRAHSRDGLLAHEMRPDEIRRELRRLGMNVPAGEMRAGTRSWAEREKALTAITAQDYSFSATLLALAAGLERQGTRFAADGRGPDVHRVQYGYCDDYSTYLILLEFGAAVLCLSGNIWGCLGALASISLIEYTMNQAGC